MKKGNLMLLAVLLIGGIFASCKDNDDEKGTIVNPKETAEYEDYGVESYDLLADVKTATRTYFNSSWKVDANGVGAIQKGKTILKEVLTFNQAGLLTNRTTFIVPDGGKELAVQDVDEIKYDTKYRLLRQNIQLTPLQQRGVSYFLSKRMYMCITMMQEMFLSRPTFIKAVRT